MPLDITSIRSQFPILQSGELVYFDSAATTQKPEVVLAAERTYYEQSNANVHRGVHGLAEKATIAYEDARTTIATFVGAKSHEIIFTKNCTEALNIVAQSWGRANLSKDDTVLLTQLDHHSACVPWMHLQKEIGFSIMWIPIDTHGNLNDGELEKYLSMESVKILSLTGLSNVLGVRPNIEKIIKLAHEADVKVVLDAAQLIVHEQIDVQQIDCDFLTFSGHKLYGPTGIGVLYAQEELLEHMTPLLHGGSMVGTVSEEGFSLADVPHAFEAGTPPIAQAVGLATAIDWLSQFEKIEIAQHESEVIFAAKKTLESMDSITILGPEQPIGCFSFVVDGVHPHDLTDLLGQKGICLRAGHHCAQPLHSALGVPASSRVSVGIYNTVEEVEKLENALEEIIPLLKK